LHFFYIFNRKLN